MVRQGSSTAADSEDNTLQSPVGSRRVYVPRAVVHQPAWRLKNRCKHLELTLAI